MVASFPTDIITFANSVSVDNIWYVYIQLPYFFFLFFSLFILFKFLTLTRWMGEKYDGVRVCWHPNLHNPYLFSFVCF